MYIGNDLQIANPSYKIIDDISSSFNGSTTSFALQVKGVAPVPFPVNTQQVTISVNGVIQEPDPTGSAGFKLLGSNIVFSSAPANGHAFFGVINAGADYVTAGSEFPDGSVTAPSFTFSNDQDSGWFRIGSGDVGYSSNGTQILNFDGNGVSLPDNKKVQLGTSSDLQLYHDGSHSYINNSTGALYLRTGTGLNVQNAGGTETYLYTEENGAVFLKYDNDTKLFTKSSGAEVTTTGAVANFVVRGKEGYGASITLASDDGDDPGDYARILQHTDEALYFQVYNAANNAYEDAIVARHDGAVSLFYDNGVKLATRSDGIDVTGKIYPTGNIHMPDSIGIKLGAGNDLNIWHYQTDNKSYLSLVNTSTLKIHNTTDDETMAQFIPNGSVELYYDNSLKFKTSSGGAHSYGVLSTSNDITIGNSSDLTFEDNGKALFGTGSDLQIYYTGSAGWIYQSESGNDVTLGANAGNVWLRTGASANDDAIKCVSDGAVELYFNGTKKLETTTHGITIGGDSSVAGDWNLEVYDSASDCYALLAGTAGAVLELRDTGSNEVLKLAANGAANIYSMKAWDALSLHTTDSSGTDVSLKCNAGGSTDLYHNGTKKFETTTSGVKVTGNYELAGSTSAIIWPEDAGTNASRQWDFRADQGAYGQFGLKYGTSSGDAPNKLAIEANANGNVELYYDGNKCLETRGDGGIEATDGNFIVGTSGHGIQFDTADSGSDQLLDDYEEGTFTPSFWASSTAFTTAPTYTSRHAHYTKIGRQVHFSIYLAWDNSAAGGAGNVYLGGLPFTQANNTAYAGIYWGWWELHTDAMASDEVMTGYINNNSTNVVMGRSHVGAGVGFEALNAYYAINGRAGNFQLNGVYYTS